MKRPSILLIAYQCGPGMGSVSQIGWEWFTHLSAEYDVTMVTSVRNRRSLEHAGAAHGVHFIDTEWFAGPLYRLARRLFPVSEHSVFLLTSLDYFLFDFLAFRLLKRLMAGGSGWDLAHRVTPVTLAAPTWIGRLGMPLVVGPLNCGLGKPAGFDAIFRQESTWLVGLRRIGHAVDRLIGSSRSASRILAATAATIAGIAPSLRNRCVAMTENGVHLERFAPSPWPRIPGKDDPLRVLFVGRLIPLKGVDMLLKAAALLTQEGRQVELEIVGDGPMAGAWLQMAGELGIASCVRFSGALSPDEVARRYRDCHVLCLPSVRESGGAVLLEAMSSARPVIALQYGGPAEIVTPEVGALVPLISPDQVVAGLAQALRTVCTDPDGWRLRGIAGRRVIEQQYSWPAKISAAGRLYRDILLEQRHAAN